MIEGRIQAEILAKNITFKRALAHANQISRRLPITYLKTKQPEYWRMRQIYGYESRPFPTRIFIEISKFPDKIIVAVKKKKKKKKKKIILASMIETEVVVILASAPNYF